MVNTRKITRLRKAKGLTKAEAARAAGMSTQHWHNIEGGRTGQKWGLSLPTLERVAKALGVKPAELIK